MSGRLDKELEDWYKWWNYNKSLIPPDNLKDRMEFAEKSLEGLLRLLITTSEDLYAVEGVRRKLYMPTGINVRGDVRRFG